jgi:hypothetical protein
MSDLMRDTLVSELELSVRIRQGGCPVVPRFRIASGDGNFVLFAPRRRSLRDQQKSERFVKGFMLWTLARWFVLSLERKECDRVVSFLVARDRRLGVMCSPAGGSLKSSCLEWLDEPEIDTDIVRLLPQRSARLGRTLYRELKHVRYRGIEVAGPF